MSGKNFDVFISYRRSDGTDKARILDLAFGIDDCRTFLDFKSLGVGAFDKRLEDAVLDAPIFVMVLTPDYFARCNEEGDWVRKEIELALDNNKIIIPINYDGKVNCPPDYLDEEFKSRVGCHNFKALHRDSSFDATVKSIFDLHIRPHLSPIHDNDSKAKVSVKADADCELILDDEIVATVQAGKTKQVFVERGEHFFTARSTEFPQIEEEIEKTIDDLKFKYSIRVKLADKLPKKPIEPVEPPKPEPPQPSVVTPTPTIVPQVPKVEPISPNDFRLLRSIDNKDECFEPIAWSTDGICLAVFSEDKIEKIWELNSGKYFQTLEQDKFNVIVPAVSPNGKYYVRDIDSSNYEIRDLYTDECFRKLDVNFYISRCCSFSPDGNYLVIGGEILKAGSTSYVLKIFELNIGKCIQTLTGHSNLVTSVCWSPDGNYLASGSDDRTVKIWKLNSGECIQTFEVEDDYIDSVSWSPDGKYLASGLQYRNAIIWDAKSGKKFKTLEVDSYGIPSICWSPDGKYLASGSNDETLIIWDAKSGERLKTLEGHSDAVYSVSWSPDGKYLASGSMDKTVKIWGVE